MDISFISLLSIRSSTFNNKTVSTIISELNQNHHKAFTVFSKPSKLIVSPRQFGNNIKAKWLNLPYRWHKKSIC